MRNTDRFLHHDLMGFFARRPLTEGDTRGDDPIEIVDGLSVCDVVLTSEDDAARLGLEILTRTEPIMEDDEVAAFASFR